MISRTDYRFRLSAEEIDRLSEMTMEKLTELGTEKKDALRIRLGVEELLLALLDTSEGGEGVFSVCQKWGRPRLEIVVRGEKPAQQEKDGTFSEYSSRILENMGLQPESFYRDGCSHIRLKLRRKQTNPILRIAAAAALAALLGCGTTLLLPQLTDLVLAIVDPLLDTFLGILTTIAGPMIFVSVTWGILCIGDAAALGTIGRKMMLRFVAITFLMTLLGFLTGMACFRLNYDAGQMTSAQFSGIYQMILNIFPSNIVAPFYENNTMQIIVVAVPFGIAILLLERKAAEVAAITEQSNLIVQSLMGLITKLIPFFVFLSLLHLFLSSSLLDLAGCWKPLVLGCLVPFLVICAVLLAVSVRYHVRLSLLVRKMLPTFLIALTTASSAASFSENVECCEKKLGIDRKITRFGIPLGMVIYMPGLAVSFILISMYMAEVYDVPVSAGWILIGILVSAVLAIAVPPIPGGSMTCYTILFAQLGIPTEAIAAATIIDIVTDFICTAETMTFLQLDLLLQADSMQLLDREVLKTDL